MRCKDAQTVLDAWIDGELAQDRQTALEHHLTTCRTCATEARGLRRLTLCLGTHPQVLPSPKLKKRIMAAFMEESGSRGLFQWWTGLGWELQAAMAASTLIGLGMGLRLGGDWTGAQLLSQYHISGFLFAAGDYLLSWA